MMGEWRKVWAFVRRDWWIHSSYRLSAFISLAHILFTLASFFFISRLVAPPTSPALAPYGGAYFPFVVLGLAFSRYLATGVLSFAGSLRDEQVQGTLEAILTTPTRSVTLIGGGLAWEMLWTTGEVLLYVGLGAACFGLDLGRINVLASLVLLVLSIGTLSSLGVLSASAALLYKEFNPVGWILGGLMRLVSGVYFPVAILPGWLEALARVVPLTYALEGLRQAVLVGAPLSRLWKETLALCGFALVLWPLALLSFSWTLRRLKATGTLSFR